MRARAVARGAGVGLLAAAALSTVSVAQIQNGSFAGTIECEALPRLRPLRTKVTMVVADGRARYEREILHPTGGPSGIFERGEGPVTPGGEVTLTTRVDTPGYGYEAEYKGRIEESVARLTGRQRWKLRNESGTIPRSCSLELMRVAQ
ncbi:MAG TPA: hypothetical protein VIE44_16415 [Methylomirabilota bacterium]|jgi:hypothetical protein